MLKTGPQKKKHGFRPIPTKQPFTSLYYPVFRRQPRSYGYPYSLLNDLKGKWRNYKEFTTWQFLILWSIDVLTGWESRLPPIQPVDDQKAAPGSAEHHRPRRPARSGRRWRGVRGEQRTQRDVLQRPALLRGTKRAKMVKNGGLSMIISEKNDDTDGFMVVEPERPGMWWYNDMMGIYIYTIYRYILVIWNQHKPTILWDTIPSPLNC